MPFRIIELVVQKYCKVERALFTKSTLCFFAAKVLSSLGLNLNNKCETYSDMTLKSIFMLNNYNYILKSLKRFVILQLNITATKVHLDAKWPQIQELSIAYCKQTGKSRGALRLASFSENDWMLEKIVHGRCLCQRYCFQIRITLVFVSSWFRGFLLVIPSVSAFTTIAVLWCACLVFETCVTLDFVAVSPVNVCDLQPRDSVVIMHAKAAEQTLVCVLFTDFNMRSVTSSWYFYTGPSFDPVLCCDQRKGHHQLVP